MIILNCKQGDAIWQSARVGIPTSSNFEKILTTKGEPSKQRFKYLYSLVGEKLINRKEDNFQSIAMQRGVELESEARTFYELIKGVDVVQVGICYKDERKLYASSPDGLVGEDGLLEVKAPLLSTHVSYLLNGGLVEDYYQQLQGQLLVTGRKWVDIISYYSGMRPLLIKVEPDKVYQKALAVELELFCSELEETIKKIK